MNNIDREWNELYLVFIKKEVYLYNLLYFIYFL